ncbi:histidine kinase dimerization/phospho-acceptor domain-containing protein [Phocaeicola plebeius]|uniref:histidine kinase dimerization/phospho-acceptor domain-containing protein n=1 Tax=Phocaeicola plebeius TaxID=310297 RepID=UPI003FEF6FF8
MALRTHRSIAYLEETVNRRAGKVPPETEYNRSITPIKKGTPIPGGSIVPGNIIQTPQPATVRSVGCVLLHLRTKIAAGYVLILFVIFGIVYIWLNEQHRRQELEITSQKIRCLRKDIHEVYVKMVDLSLIGETVLDWNEEDMNIYHKKRLEVDSLLSLFKSSYRSERIDSVCRLLAEKENLLNKIMLVLNEQEEIKDKIARRVPVIARKSSQEEPPKRKRTGFLGLFGKKEEAKPTVTTSMLNTLNSDVIARRKIMLTVTHELRTPLTAINGYGELLAQTENENKRIEYTQNIRQAARKILPSLKTW